MIIRSQDKKSITTDLNLHIKKWNPEKKERIDIFNEKGCLLGTYSTEEKAIKVLDMICAEYQYAEECKHTGVGSAPPEFVFQMPSDEEVEV